MIGEMEGDRSTGRAASPPGDTHEGYSEINHMIRSLIQASQPL
jgi:hypothetical protein